MKFIDDLMDYEDLENTQENLGGSNFLVSAVLLLRRQKKELQVENVRLKERLHMIERQNAAFLNLSADRLLEKSQAS